MSSMAAAAPSPFTADLLFNCITRFVCRDSTPLTRHQTSMLSLSDRLLHGLLKRISPKRLLSPRIVHRIRRRLRQLTPNEETGNRRKLFSLLHRLKPVAIRSLTRQRANDDRRITSCLRGLLTMGQVFPTVVDKRRHLTYVSSTTELHSTLNMQLPRSLPRVCLREIDCPLHSLFLHCLQTRTLIATRRLTRRFDLNVTVIRRRLRRLHRRNLIVGLRRSV